MTSEIRVDKIHNEGGDNDSGLDMSTNDVVAVKIAGSEKMRVHSDGLVGIGETTPTSALHVKGGAGANIAIQSTAGSHWRIGDAVGSSNGNLVVYDYTNSAARNILYPTGRNQQFSNLSGHGQKHENAHSSDPSILWLHMSGNAPDNNSNYFAYCGDNAVVRCIIYSDGDLVNHDNSYGSTSDERIKQDIKDANSQWDDIKALKIRNYKKKDDVSQYKDKAWEQIGVIAQELEASGMDKLIKEADPSEGDIRSSAEFGTLYEDGDTIPDGKKVGDVKEVKSKVKNVKYSVLYMKAVKALQEAMARIETLETKVAALEAK